MSEGLTFKAVLDRAVGLEKQYDWLQASEAYSEALKLLPEQDYLNRGDINERSGNSLFRAASQADKVEEFRKLMRLSVESCEKAADLFTKAGLARGPYCRAMAQYSDSWLVENSSQKKELLDSCWKLMKESFERFDADGDQLGYGKTFRGYAFCLIDRCTLERDWRECKRIVEEAMTYGQNAIARLSQIGDVNELAWAYTLTSFLIVSYLDFFGERRSQLNSMISSFSEKALRLSERIEDAQLLVLLYHTLFGTSTMAKGDLQDASTYAEKELLHSERSKDHFLLGNAHFTLNFVTSHKAAIEEDPERRIEKLKLAIGFAEEAIRYFLMVRRYAQLAFTYGAYLVDNYRFLAEFETSLEGKRALLKRAVEVGRKGTEYGQLSGSPEAMQSVFHVLSKAVFFLSQTETDPSEKRKLLEEALDLREKNVKISDQLAPPNNWDHGVSQNYLAIIKADLAKMEKDEGKKRRLLEEAVLDMEKCLEECTKSLQTESYLPSFFAFLGWYYDWFGQILDQLYSLTRDEKVIERAVEVCQSASQVYQKAEMPSRVAEAYWKAARLCDRLGQYIRAADNFQLASKNYQLVSEKIPQLKDFYQDHALYMQAWTEIEKARHHHARQEYGSAEEHFKKAAQMHRPLKQWSYLAPDYSAWAQVENAEELSRQERSEEAIKAFEEAAGLFSETKRSLQAQVDRIENPDEQEMVTSMVKATDTRHDYCHGRIAVEEARILDKKGDHYSSSEKYDLAAKTFEKISRALESEQERNEFKLITCLSRAWRKMTLAEAEAKPSLYAEASQLFEETMEFTPNEKTKMLVLGHSRFCKALEAGTRYADTRNTDMYADAIRCLESAANYYVKAGFPKASEYSEATKLLFDAYMHMDSAARETDPERKARLYTMAEKVLQTSAGSFMRAEHPEKREQVLGLLEKTRKERELAISLTEVLHAPAIVSTTSTFVTPTPTREEAVGSERFEHADVQANLIIRRKELAVGENLDLEIELVNAGKGPALLIKVNEVIPESFEIAEKPEVYRVEDSYLNMKGKRLDPLKTEEIRLVLKPKVQGSFSLKPTVLYLDENGNYKSREPEPVIITVKELGIKGWLKGER